MRLVKVMTVSAMGAVLALSLLASPALAKGKRACADDAKKLCPDSHGKALRQCLKEHEADLSAACKERMERAASRHHRRAKATPAT
jgi:hypothetical protein